MPSSSSSPTPSENSAAGRRWAIAFAVIALFGFLDAAYLTIQHYSGGTLHCFIVSGCDVVTTSRYATIGPIPVALLGALYYLAVIIASLVAIDSGRRNMLRAVGAFTVVGLITSVILVWIQASILHAFCFYCLMSAGISTILSIVGLTAWWRTRSQETI